MAINANHLRVEDNDTRGVVVGLMRHHIRWPEEESGWPAKIEVMGSSDCVLSAQSLAVKMKESGLVALGLIVDADADFAARWDAVRNISSHLGAAPPSTCPECGLILQIGAQRFGAWIMPDNSSRGMLENFCGVLVPQRMQPSWDLAHKCVDEARSRGATYKDSHLDKARIHTFLAWQDPPGERMGVAITKKILEPGCSSAEPFVRWFRKLFSV